MSAGSSLLRGLGATTSGLLLVVVEHVSKNVLGILEALGHLSIVRV